MIRWINRLFGWHSPEYKMPDVGQEVYISTSGRDVKRCVYAVEVPSISIINPHRYFKGFTFVPVEYYNPEKPSHVGGIPTTCVKYWRAIR